MSSTVWLEDHLSHTGMAQNSGGTHDGTRLCHAIRRLHEFMETQLNGYILSTFIGSFPKSWSRMFVSHASILLTWRQEIHTQLART